jgi:predicted DNA-binding transcriptional regulator YafY
MAGPRAARSRDAKGGTIMLLTKAQRDAIDNLAAMFFEKSDDLIAVSSQLESVIEHRCKLVVERDHTYYFSSFNSKPELKSPIELRDYVRQANRNKSVKNSK